MASVDVLAYGTHLVYDGTGADPSRLADGALVARVAALVAATLDGAAHATRIVVEEDDGVSAAMVMTEASIALHAFPGLGSLCLDVFSVRRRRAEDLYHAVEEAFAVGRSTSRREVRARAPRPFDPAGIRRRLRGERAYAEARFTDLRAHDGA